MNAEDGSPVTTTYGKVHMPALVLFCAGLTSLVFFNLLPGLGPEQRGWNIWIDIVRAVQRPELFRDTTDLITIASLLILLPLVMASPFLVLVYLKSRLAWWLATLAAGVSTYHLAVNFNIEVNRIGLGGWCLLAAPALNFAGLLSLRFAKRPGDSPRQS